MGVLNNGLAVITTRDRVLVIHILLSTVFDNSFQSGLRPNHILFKLSAVKASQ